MESRDSNVQIEAQVARWINFIKNKGFKPNTPPIHVCCKCSESIEIRIRLLRSMQGTLKEFFKNHEGHGGYTLRSGDEKWDLPIENDQEMNFDKVEPTTIDTNNKIASIPSPAPNTPIESPSSQSDFDLAPLHLAESDTDTFLEDGGSTFNVSSAEELNLLIERVNQKYFYVVIGKNGCVGYKDYDSVFEREMVHYLTPYTFHESCPATLKRPYLCDGNKEPEAEQITKIWIRHPRRRHYKGVVFSPNRPVPRNKLNLWQDFRQDARAGNCQPFLDFIFEVICNRTSDHYNYVIAWMADAIQNITTINRPGVAIVLRGDRGTGKGFFATHFGSLFKQYFIHVTQPDHLTGKFNAHLHDCLLLFADEVAGSKKAMGVLQGLITESTMMIEIKGQDPFQAPNYMRIMMASNFDWVVPAGPNERRWGILDVSSCHMQETFYFSKLDAFMKNGGREALLYYLRNYDYSKVDLRKIPKTSALADQLLSTMGSIDFYWFGLLQKGSYPDSTSLENEVKWGAALMVKEDVHKDYLQTIKPERKDAHNSTAFWIRIRKKLCPSLREARLSTTEYKRAFELPSLKEARNLFDKFYGHKFPWEEV